MRVALDVEGERAARRALGDEGVLRAGAAAVGEPVVVARVGRQAADQRLHRQSRTCVLRRGLGGVRAGRGAVVVVDLHCDGGDQVHCDRRVGGPAQDLGGDEVGVRGPGRQRGKRDRCRLGHCRRRAGCGAAAARPSVAEGAAVAAGEQAATTVTRTVRARRRFMRTGSPCSEPSGTGSLARRGRRPSA